MNDSDDDQITRIDITGLTLDQFVDFVYSYKHQIDREDENRETFLILDRTCKYSLFATVRVSAWRRGIAGKGFLNKDDFARAFERLNIKLSPDAIEAAFKYVLHNQRASSIELLVLGNWMWTVTAESAIETSTS